MTRHSAKALPPREGVYQPPQPCLGPCQSCGALVLFRVYLMDEKRFMDLGQPVSPALGEPHVCTFSTAKHQGA